MRPPDSPPRRRGRPAGKPLTQRELAARRANIKKAHAVPYEVTEKRDAASMANLQKAIAGRRSPKGNAVARLNALKHGFSARDMEASVVRLGEDRDAYAEHLRRFERLFAPQDQPERWLVRALAMLVWRRLRLYRAQAYWERRQLQNYFNMWRPDLTAADDVMTGTSPAPAGNGPAATSSKAPTPAPAPALVLDAKATQTRAYVLPNGVLNRWQLEDQVHRSWVYIVRCLRALVRKRSKDTLHFFPAPPPRERRPKQMDRLLEEALGRHPAESDKSQGQADGEEAEAKEKERGRLPSEATAIPNHFSVRQPAADPKLVVELHRVFLPANRWEKRRLRRIARIIARCLARYEEESHRDAERLQGFLANAAPLGGQVQAGGGNSSSCVASIQNPSSPPSPSPSQPIPALTPGQTLTLARGLVDALFLPRSLRDELDPIEVGIDRALEELVRRRSRGRLRFEVDDWEEQKRCFAVCLERTLSEDPDSLVPDSDDEPAL